MFQVDDSWGNEDEKCVVCTQTVYPSERLSVEGKIFHKPCFKCAECKSTLRAGSYAAIEGVYYCKPHYAQKFKLKGNYSEGFGLEKPTAKWSGKADASPAAAPAPGEVEPSESSS